ncbi:zinc-binding alcohol dehydrogenase family protein [Dactylosporangium roseum]|uniref:Zinc-binding alcohol dehydrogenase family protein n=1 Tax=Dactylosporangium roseum TaxID=47989 RepID=A0ABY5Z177_9ACTN|nr:zinc-binding alcohol dehydrogenase family protein [Dactylosporangium roseum]UWZ34244.1 zinc-binding alcohol dehydrogenase family protein [Dactylosporangium roseum]
MPADRPVNPAVVLARAGNEPQIEIVEEAVERPGPDEVEVQLVAADVSPLDRQIAAGRMPVAAAPPLRLGTTAVARVVPSAAGGALDGALVYVLGELTGMGITRPGTFAERFTVRRDQVVALPGGLDPRRAAAGSAGGLAARLALFDTAALTPDETVLVLGGTGAVGRAAVTVAAAHGARVIAAARTPSAIPQAGPAVTPIGLANLAGDVLELTGGAGADVIIDCVGGPVLSAAMRAGAFRCRHVVLGYTAGMVTEIVIGALMAKEHRLMGFNLMTVAGERQRAVLADVLADLADGRFEPTIGAVYDLSDAPTAFARAGATVGRTLLTR